MAVEGAPALSFRAVFAGDAEGVVKVRDKLRLGASEYLEPNEQIQAVFLALSGARQYNDRAVIATDRRLVLFRLNFSGRPVELMAETARGTKIGPCRGVVTHRFDAFGVRLAVSRRFFADVAEMDRLAGLHNGSIASGE